PTRRRGGVSACARSCSAPGRGPGRAGGVGPAWGPGPGPRGARGRRPAGARTQRGGGRPRQGARAGRPAARTRAAAAATRAGRPEMQTNPAHLGDPANYYMAFTMDNRTDNDADTTALRIDAEYEMDRPVLQSFRFGVRFSDTTSENHDTGYDWQPIYQQWMRG